MPRYHKLNTELGVFQDATVCFQNPSFQRRFAAVFPMVVFLIENNPIIKK